MFPLGRVLFPTQPLLLHVFEPRYRVMVDRCLSADSRFGVVLITRGSEVGGGDERASVGTLTAIEHAQCLADGRWVLGVRGIGRIRVVTWLPDDPHPQAEIVEPDGHPMSRRDGEGAARTGDTSSPPVSTAPASESAPPASAPSASPSFSHLLQQAVAAVRRTRALASELGLSTTVPVELQLNEDPATATWQACAWAPVGSFDAQQLLEADGPEDRCALLVDLMQQLADELSLRLSEQ
jgi:uncharacterized protein